MPQLWGLCLVDVVAELADVSVDGVIGPEPDRVVGTARRHLGPIGTEGDGIDDAGMAGWRHSVAGERDSERATLRNIPEAHRAVSYAGCQRFSVGTEGDALNPVGGIETGD